MAPCKAAFFVGIIFCFSNVRAEVEDLHPLLTSTETTLQGAKTHVDHMINISPLPNHEKIPPIIKNETDHLSYELKKLATKLHEISAGEHKAEVKTAVEATVTHLNEAAATLEHVGSDLKGDNTKYFAAAEKLHHEMKSLVDATPCEEITPLIKKALNELTHDVNNYQYGIHDAVGPHAPGVDEHAGHKHEGADHSHHVHQHHGSSSEESSEEHKDHKH